MCTLSVVPYQDSIVISVNRDELRSRVESHHMETNSEYCYPVDEESGGTWLGAHAEGVVFAILNRYQDENAQPGQISRGGIIPILLKADESVSLVRLKDYFRLSDFSPFDCVRVDRYSVEIASWDGVQLDVQRKQLPLCLTSSSERLDEVRRYRYQLWEHFRAQGELSPQRVLNEFHTITSEAHPRDSVRVDRPLTHTKSISQVIINAHQVDFRYWPEWALATSSRLNEGDATSHRFCYADVD